MAVTGGKHSLAINSDFNFHPMTLESSKLIGSPRVLVVDDEVLMREVAAMMIEEDGGVAIQAASAAEALKALAESPGSIDCIFSDFSMPEMNGYDLYLKVQEIRAEIPFVMISGLKMVPEVRALLESGKMQFVSKPFHQKQLCAAINRARGV